jgi:hypothetical protein
LDVAFRCKARILHEDTSFIRESVTSHYSVPPDHVAAGFGHACGGEGHHREPSGRPLS